MTQDFTVAWGYQGSVLKEQNKTVFYCLGNQLGKDLPGAGEGQPNVPDTYWCCNC